MVKFLKRTILFILSTVLLIGAVSCNTTVPSNSRKSSSENSSVSKVDSDFSQTQSSVGLSSSSSSSNKVSSTSSSSQEQSSVGISSSSSENKSSSSISSSSSSNKVSSMSSSSQEQSSVGLSSSSENKSSSSMSSSSSSSVEVLPQYLSVNGLFEQDGNLFTSKQNDSILIDTRQTFTQGTMSVYMEVTSIGTDNGIIFGLTNPQNLKEFWETDVSYYFFFLSRGNTAYLGKVNNGGWQLCQTNNYNVTVGTYLLEVSLDRNTNSISCYVNGELVVGFIDENLLQGGQFGLRAGASGMNYQKPTISSTTKEQTFNANQFVAASGSISGDENFINTVGANTIAYRNNDYFRYGYLEVTINLSNTTECNGIIFGLSNNTSTFWEQVGVSYYFLFIANGSVSLGKTDNGVWTHCGGEYNSQYQGNCRLGVYRDVDTIYVFVNGEAFITYKDANALTGTRYGVRAGAGGTSYTKFINLSGQDITNAGLHGLSVINGGATGTNHELGKVVKFNSANTFVAFNNTFEQGSISAEIAINKVAPHWTNGPLAITGKTGIVFGYIDQNNCYKFFTEGETEQVKLCKYTNGVEEVLFSNYMSATQLWNAVRPFKYKVTLIDGKAYCYFYNRLFTVNDVNIASGAKAGMFSESENAIVLNNTINSDTEIQKVDTLMFGHSYFDCWLNYKNDLANAGLGTILNIGLGGSIASQWDNFRSAIVAYEPKNVIYMIGINDVSAGITPQDTLNSIKSLCTYLKQQLPNVEITLVGTPHCPARWTGSDCDRKVEVEQLNALERVYVSENESFLNYAEMEYVFCEGTTPLSKYFFDNLHPTAHSFAQKVAPIIKSAIQANETTKNIRKDNNCQTFSTDSAFVSNLENSVNGLNLVGRGLRLDKSTYHKDIGVSFKISSSQDVAMAGVLLRGNIVNGKINGILVNLVSNTNKFVQVFYLKDYDPSGSGTMEYMHGWIYPSEVKDVIFNVTLVGTQLKVMVGTNGVSMDISTYSGGSANVNRDAYLDGYFGVYVDQIYNNNLLISSLALDLPYMWSVLAPSTDTEIINNFKYLQGVQIYGEITPYETNESSFGASGSGFILNDFLYHSNVSYSFSVNSNEDISSFGTLLRATYINNKLNGYFVNVISNATQKFLQVFIIKDNTFEYIHGWIYSSEVKNVTFNVTLIGNQLTLTDNFGKIISMDLKTNSGGTDGATQRAMIEHGYFGVYCGQTQQAKITISNLNV